jgi:DNA-binding helix-hairpin-helix protein with protein kinase domain
LRSYLSSRRIEHASIQDIGPSRKATLRSYGIESAADVDRRTIRRIDGFGDSLTARLCAWRSSVEQGFRFDPSKNITPSEVSALDAELSRIRARLSSDIMAAVASAEQERRTAEASLVVVYAELLRAASSLANARAAAAGMTR